MNLFSLAAFTGFLVSLFAGIDGFRRNTKTVKGVLFLALALLIGAWCLGYTFLYAAESEAAAMRIYRLTGPSWCFLPAVVLHFILILAGVPRRRRLLVLPAYVLAALFSWRVVTGVLLAERFITGEGVAVVEIHDTGSPWYAAYVTYQVSSLLISSAVLILWRKKSTALRFRKQADLILLSLFSTLIVLNALNFLPSLLGYPLPAAAPTVLVLVVLSSWYATTRYRMLELTPELAAGYIMSKMLDGVMLIDTEGVVREANNRVVEMLDARRRDILSVRFSRFFPGLPFLASGESVELETMFGPDAKKRIPVLLALSPLVDREGEPAGTVAVVHDLRSRKELEQARRAAEEAGKAKSRFLAHMSHDIKTPLNSIIGYSRLLVSDPGLSARDRRLALSIAENGNHLLELLSDILDITQMEAGRMRIERQEFSLLNLLKEAAIGFRLTAREKGLDFLVTLRPGLPRFAVGDKKRIRQILHNLLSNAVKYTRSGKVELKAGTVPGSGGGGPQLQFEVSDTGPGIPPELRQTLFEPFTRGREHADFVEGRGLGLTICRELAETMGGTIEYRAGESGGTIFTVAIPAGISSGGGNGLLPEGAFAEPGQRKFPSFRVPPPGTLRELGALIGKGDIGGFITRIGKVPEEYGGFISRFRNLADAFEISRIQNEIELLLREKEKNDGRSD